MKGGLCIIYTSLLTISVLSSCAFFILVVALQDEGVVGQAVDASGLHNVSQKLADISDKDVEPDLPPGEEHSDEGPQSDTKQFPEDEELTFPETLSLNSVTTDGLPDTGQPPILVSLADNAKLDLKTADELLFVNDSEQHNDTKTFTIVDGSEAEEGKQEEEKKQETLVVIATPIHETRQTEDAFQVTPAPIFAEAEVESQTDTEQAEPIENIPIKSETPQEDIPSFSEWAQKQLAEAEKKDTVLNQSTQPSHSNTNFSSKGTKVRSKNYASPACGAKVVAVNPEAGSPSSILSPNRDEYMLNTCTSRTWFVVELCEAVQAQKIEIANFELFSSTPKDIAVYFSDRFPTRDWASVGQFTAEDMRDVQSFDLFPHMFGKFIKVEMLSHHGSEHYCPISLFKVYGTSEFEVLEKESSQHAAHIDDDDDDEIIDVPVVPTADSEASKNLFGSARDAVMSIMKKAAQVLVKTEVPKNVSSEHNDTSTDNMYKKCCSPSHIIVCDNCSQVLYNEVYELISCSSDELTNLVSQVFLGETFKCTGICQQFGLDFKSTKTIEFKDERVAYIKALFPPKYLAALCNIIAIAEKKVVLNTSYETELNVTTNITENYPTQNINDEINVEQDKLVPSQDNASSNEDNLSDSLDLDASPIIAEQFPETKTLEQESPKEDNIDEKEEPIITNEIPVSEKPDLEEKFLEPDIKPTETQKSETDTKDSAPKADSKNGKVETTVEKPKDGGVNTADDASDQMLIGNDSFLSDLDQLTADPTPAGAAVSQTNNLNQGQTLQKESVFLRLSNRVKTLERNMSLSGQYLEELSRRYKKQVEEMQKTFEKTILQMTEERRKSNEREQKYLEKMTNLQEQLAQVAAAMRILMEERDSWFGTITFFKFFILQSMIVVAVVYYVRRRRHINPLALPIPKKVKKKEKLRRKSVEGVSGHATPAVKKRRPSEEALQIARQSTEEIDRDEDEGGWQVARKNRRRKTSILHRNPDVDKQIWVRQDSIGALQETLIPLDDEEFVAPVTEPSEFIETTPSVITIKELPKTNGSIFNSFKVKTKTRRLSSPAFLRTFSRNSSRSNPSPVVSTLEPVFNGQVDKKAGSESPTASLWSQSTELSQVNGFDSESARSKKKKSLKNMFRKVF